MPHSYPFHYFYIAFTLPHPHLCLTLTLLYPYPYFYIAFTPTLSLLKPYLCVTLTFALFLPYFYLSYSMLCFSCAMTEAYVSDEIIVSRAGVRVRIGNTDAEGRMVMADLLCHMKEKVSKGAI